VLTSPNMLGDYYQHVGFRHNGRAFELEL